jgi:SAM-dependent methyltransferase
MVGVDFDYIKKLIDLGVIGSPCLDLGSGGAGELHNCKNLITESGLRYVGTDILHTTNVDVVANFEDEIELNKERFSEKFASILVLNVLEHTFDPIRVLDNVFAILQPGGTCVIITPTVWPIHDFPIDCYRINPTFYEEYCKRRSLHLIQEHFEYVGFHNVKENMDSDTSTYVLPKPTANGIGLAYSKIIHKLFNTFGRRMSCESHIATGVVITNKAN